VASGARRLDVSVYVNPAFRRMGLGRSLLQQAPTGRSLQAMSSASVLGARELLESSGFVERHRDGRLRRQAAGLTPLEARAGATLQVDPQRNVPRALEALSNAFDDEEPHEGLWTALLARPSCRVIYLRVGDGDEGICVVAGSERAKKRELTEAGEPRIGVVERVGVAKALRGKKLSRPLVRAGLVALAEAGFQELEVRAEQRKPAAVALYEKEGFTAVDDDIHWIRREITRSQ
jgi:GNAT superfamily N-acetyltransferase